jgi:hypothetical protein
MLYINRQGREAVQNLIKLISTMTEEELLAACEKLPEMLGTAEASLLLLLIELELDKRKEE